eukprot:scaffold183704_cov31-Tisochrysis_lutea.AAC.1
MVRRCAREPLFLNKKKESAISGAMHTATTMADTMAARRVRGREELLNDYEHRKEALRIEIVEHSALDARTGNKLATRGIQRVKDAPAAIVTHDVEPATEALPRQFDRFAPLTILFDVRLIDVDGAIISFWVDKVSGQETTSRNEDVATCMCAG